MHAETLDALVLFTPQELETVRKTIYDSMFSDRWKRRLAHEQLQRHFGELLDSAYTEQGKMYINILGKGTIQTVCLGDAGTQEKLWKQYNTDNPGYNYGLVPLTPSRPTTLQTHARPRYRKLQFA